MSAIHKALREADGKKTQNAQTQFNPLWKSEKKTKSSMPLYSIAALLALGALALFLWPEAENKPATQAKNSVELSNNNTNANSVADPQPALETEQAAQPQPNLVETDALPDVVETLQVPVETAAKMDTTLEESPTDNNRSGETEQVVHSNDANQKASQADSTIEAVETTEVNTVKSDGEQAKPKQSEIVPAKEAERSVEIVSNRSFIQSKTAQWQQETENHIRKGEIEQAERLLKQWISTLPKDITPRIWLAKIYVNNGFYQAAEPLIANLDHEEAQGLMGIIYERTSRPALASNVFENLYRSSPNQGKWLLFWAINAENSGELAKSSALYQNYLKVFSDDDANLTTFATVRLKALRGQ
jgi:cytochrome c-type biogenesis protein CcmH/NrfG